MSSERKVLGQKQKKKEKNGPIQVLGQSIRKILVVFVVLFMW